MTVAEVNEAKGLRKDATSVGRWGDGGVEMAFTSLDELPNIIGLVCQSYEHEVGGGGQP